MLSVATSSAAPVANTPTSATTTSAAASKSTKSRKSSSKKAPALKKAPSEPVAPAAAIDATASGSDQEPTNAVAPSTADADAGINPFVLVVQKRIRTLRKRMAKIEKYEADRADGKCTLNEDQLNAIRKKDEVLALVKEFEEMQKQLEEKDIELCKKQKKTAKAEKIEQQKKLAAVTDEMQRHFDGQVELLSRFFYGVNAVLPMVPSSVVSMADKEALVHLQRTLTGYEMDPAIEPVSMSVHAQTVLKKLMSMSEDSAVGDLSFRRIVELIETAFAFIQAPPAVEPQFMVDESAAAAAVAEVVEAVAADVTMPVMAATMLTESAEVAGVRTHLSFMTASSVIVEDEMSSSPEVVQVESVTIVQSAEPAEAAQQTSQVQQQQPQQRHGERQADHRNDRRSGRGGSGNYKNREGGRGGRGGASQSSRGGRGRGGQQRGGASSGGYGYYNKDSQSNRRQSSTADAPQ